MESDSIINNKDLESKLHIITQKLSSCEKTIEAQNEKAEKRNKILAVRNMCALCPFDRKIFCEFCDLGFCEHCFKTNCETCWLTHFCCKSETCENCKRSGAMSLLSNISRSDYRMLYKLGPLTSDISAGYCFADNSDLKK